MCSTIVLYFSFYFLMVLKKAYKCCTCKAELLPTEFWRRGGTRRDLSAECKACIRQRRHKYRRETKAKVIDMLGGCCAKCGHTSFTGVSLSLDHKKSTEKSNSAANVYQWKWERIIAEIQKGDCWLLCLNCHAELEEERRLVFLVEDAPDGGYTARTLGKSVLTQADDLKIFREIIRNAV